MPPQTIVVCEAQVPFVTGGAEYHVRELVRQLQRSGFDAERVSVPFKWYPRVEIAAHAAAWRLLDLSESNGRPVDLLIATKFPTYFARHPQKVAWLIHQHRAAYELCGTPYSDFAHSEEDVALRDDLVALDTAMLADCRRLFANSANTAGRVARYNGLAVTPLYHPPRLAEALRPGPAGSYILSVGRLEGVKRVDLAIRAMAHVPRDISLRIAGTGTMRRALETVAAEAGVADRVELLGEVSDADIVALYAGALAVIFPPYDEDYGYVTLEAFLAHKPVVTTVDAGGPNEFVRDGENGWVTAPDPRALGDAVTRLALDRRQAAAMGDAGYERARGVTWAGVIDALTGHTRSTEAGGAR
ncbi:MAG TPA: glycosyltransferase family 4 protein [Vicinamibacterales bacterium]|nr:glycosyltransferase family 4 protein [Vicinamibacterales bacterium]